MLSDKLLEGLNKQMNFEFYSAHAYLAMGAYCMEQNLDGFANFFLVQYEEEKFHAMKLFRFINALGYRATITGFGDPNNNFNSLLDVYEQAYAHEKEVTRRIYDLADLALNEREHATMQFLKWFIDEQVEEEATFDTIVHKLKRFGDDSNTIYLLDAEFAGRTFTPPAEG